LAVANRTVTKRELCERIAKQTGQTQVVTKQIIQRFLDQIIDGLSNGNRLDLRNFGVFDTRLQKARKARNPRAKPGTDPVVYVGPRAVVTFKVGKEMQEQAQQALQQLQQKES
jgi:integration host factor subunit beta